MEIWRGHVGVHVARLRVQPGEHECSVFFTSDADGFIEPGSPNIAGLDALKTPN